MFSLPSQKGFSIIQSVFVFLALAILVLSVFGGFVRGKQNTRDVKRISDIQHLQKALDSYHKDFGFYPVGQNGVAVGKEDTFKSYVSWPNPPTPSDGSCTAEQNYYYYRSQNSGESYTLDFCLGSKVGEISAGLRQAGPNGIK